MQILIIVIVVLAFFSLLCATLPVVFFNTAIKAKPRRKLIKHPPNRARAKFKNEITDFENWYFSQNIKYEHIKSLDGLSLCTQILENENSKRTVIMMHGFRAQDHSDFVGSVRFFYEMGFNVVLPHQRGHERSEGKHLSFGYFESLDCKQWVDFVISRYGEDTEIILYGVSMGSATVMISTSLNLPRNVKFCIADCGYSSTREIFSHVMCKKYHLPAFPLVNVASFICKKYAKFDIDEKTPLKSLAENTIPILFIHGEKDKFVPCDMTYKNYKACTSEKELLVVKDAYHAMSFLVAPDLCKSKVKEFIKKYLSKKEDL